MVLQRWPSVKNKSSTAAGLIPAAVFFAAKGKVLAEKVLTCCAAAGILEVQPHSRGILQE
jgi:hypothetical protein